MSLKMVRCKCCGVQVGVKSGLSGGGHCVGLLLTLFTGLLFAPVYLLMILVSGNTRCSQCGNIAKNI